MNKRTYLCIFFLSTCCFFFRRLSHFDFLNCICWLCACVNCAKIRKCHKCKKKYLFKKNTYMYIKWHNTRKRFACTFLIKPMWSKKKYTYSSDDTVQKDNANLHRAVLKNGCCFVSFFFSFLARFKWIENSPLRNCDRDEQMK